MRCYEDRKKFIPATDVDHKIPARVGGFYCSDKNLQPLCKSCHSKKTFAERQKSLAELKAEKTRAVYL